MKPASQGRSIIILVWILVTMGLVGGLFSNAIVGWTLFSLNRERLLLLEQENLLAQAAQKLKRSGQIAQAELLSQLQEIPPSNPAKDPAEEFSRHLMELRASVRDPSLKALLDNLDGETLHLGALWSQAENWRLRHLEISRDRREKRTLQQARELLQTLRSAVEIYEGRQRLTEARLLLRRRQAQDAEAQALSREILQSQSDSRPKALKEIKTELVDLSRMVEMLAGEEQFDHLTDLKDNQLKPTLERLESQVNLLGRSGLAIDPPLPRQQIETLKEILFGKGFVIYLQYQTIQPGEGGLYNLSRNALLLRRDRDRLQSEIRDFYQRLEGLCTSLADSTRQRVLQLSQQAELDLKHDQFNLLTLSLLTLLGFFILGLVISRKARKQVDALVALRRQNELILNSAAEGIVGLDRQGRTTFINPAGAAKLGLAVEEILGRNIHEYLTHTQEDGSPCPEEACPIRDTLESDRPHHVENEVFWKKGEGHFPVEYSITPIQTPRGETEGAVLSFQDISERKASEATLQKYYGKLERRERELFELNRNLEQRVSDRTALLEEKSLQLIRVQEDLLRAEKLAGLGTLAAGVAHEINNPSAIIRGNVEILLGLLPADSDLREEAEEILKQTERISLITGNMLSLARNQTIRWEKVHINTLLKEILAQISHQIPLGQVEILTELAPTLPPLEGSVERLRQVFTNLLLNALQAMQGQGRLRVSTRAGAERIEILIADTGPGIPAEIRDKIFNPFFTTKSGGTGLGLSVSYGIVQALGGMIEVEGEAGKGCVFRVSLPG